jgi:hypothetical protein
MRRLLDPGPLPLGRRLAGSIDNVGDVLAIADGEDYR